MNAIPLASLIASLFAAKRVRGVAPKQALLLEALGYVMIDLKEGRLTLPDPTDIDAIVDAIVDACNRNR